ncbi:hypothetical protein ACSXDM_15450 (plasmid) [Clostridium perfringens]
MNKLTWNEKWVLLVDDNSRELEIVELEDLKYREFSKKDFKLDLVENLATYDNNYKIIVREDGDYKWIAVEQFLCREKENFLNTVDLIANSNVFGKSEWDNQFILLINEDTKMIDVVEIYTREMDEQNYKIDLVENLCLYKDYFIREIYIINKEPNVKIVSVEEFLNNEKRDFINNLELNNYFI